MGEMNIKGVLSKFGILRDYSFLVFPLIITVVAIVLLVVSPLMSGKLRKKIEKDSISGGARQVDNLLNSAPSVEQAEIEAQYQRQYSADANKISQLSLQSSYRPLISYKLFPEPKDKSTLIFKDFGNLYCSRIDKLISEVKGVVCPADTEIDKYLKLSGSFSGSRRTMRRSSIYSGQGGDTESELIIDALCDSKAKSGKVYVDADDISGYGLWQNYDYQGWDEALEQCWYWQIGIWVIEDVFSTVSQLNADANDEMTAPVKRLLEISFPDSKQTSRGQSRSAGSMKLGKRKRNKIRSDKPQYAITIDNCLTEPFTGHFCSDEFDVLHFKAVVIVDSRKIASFMKELCSSKEEIFRGFSGDQPPRKLKHNQITILESNIVPVVRDDADNELYRYGEDAVVTLTVICEYIIQKSAYEDIKPQMVKDYLANPEGEDKRR